MNIPPETRYDGRKLIPVLMEPWRSVRTPEFAAAVRKLKKKHGPDNVAVGKYNDLEIIYVAEGS